MALAVCNKPRLLHTESRRMKMKYQLEIRAGEGGNDAKLFVEDLMNAYVRMFNRKN